MEISEILTNYRASVSATKKDSNLLPYLFRITPSLFPKRAPLSPQAPLPQEAGM